MRVSHNMHHNHLPCLKKKSVQSAGDSLRLRIEATGSTYQDRASAKRGRTEEGVVTMMLFMIPDLAECPENRVNHGSGSFPQQGNATGTRARSKLPNAWARMIENRDSRPESILMIPDPVTNLRAHD